MKKGKILSILLLVACVLTFAAGCTNNYSGSSEPSRTPSKSEIKTAVRNMENWSTLGGTFKKMVKQMFQLTIGGQINNELGTDVIGLIKGDEASVSKINQKLGETYGIDATGTKTYTNVSQVARLATSTSYVDQAKIDDKKRKPITIIKHATLTHRDGTKETVNVVGLNGLSTSRTDATSLATAIYSGCQVQNEYIYDIYYAIYNTLKGDEKTPLYIVGVSLGGMAAQQVAGLDNLTHYFDIKYVIAAASPMISPEAIDYSTTVVRRMVDEDDVVPQLSASFNGDYQSKYKNNTAIVRNHPTYNTFVGSHVFGYHDETLWGDVDVLGELKDGGFDGKGATLTVNWDNASWHDSPEAEQQESEVIEKVQQ